MPSQEFSRNIIHLGGTIKTIINITIIIITKLTGRVSSLAIDVYSAKAFTAGNI